MGFLSPIKKAVSKVTNSKVAKAAPGGKSIGKSLRNAPGMKMPAKPVTGGLAPSAPLQATQMPAVMNPPEPLAPPQEGLMNRIPGGDQNMQPIPDIGAGMGQPMVMPRNPAPQPAPEQGGLAPQMDFAALAQRIPQRRPMVRMR